MKSLAGVKWGADKKTLLHFYCIYIRSRLDYGCEVYGAALTSQLNKLEIIQNTALRIALGAFKSSPVLALQAVFPPLPVTLTLQPSRPHLH